MFLSIVLPWTFLLCGAGLLIGGALAFRRTRAFVQRAATAPGQVVSLEREVSRDPDGRSEVYRPVVAFTGPSGERVAFASIMASHPPTQRVGETVEVLYDPACPSDARIRSFLALWGLPLLLEGLGWVFAAVGLGLLIGLIPV